MNANIRLSLAIAAIAMLTAGLAGHLAATKAWHKWVFWGGGLLMLILITIQTYKNETDQQALHAQLTQIQKNTENPPRVEVNIPPSARHAHLFFENPVEIGYMPLMPWHEGEEPILNITFHPLEGTITGSRFYAKLLVLPTSIMRDSRSPETLLQKYRTSIESVDPIIGGTMIAGTRGSWFHSYKAAPLKQPDVPLLEMGKEGLCVLGFARWQQSDDSSSYETDVGRCYVLDAGYGYAWHTLLEDNKEIKLP